ncbi:Por secretion system C-terminal sorting domain-containing protein [Dyadobacter soli]|uniref:Por secretion system C-terminal sorting domain-containing protein n=1 Tax=Dyadobacter soli TaxID=659014 RepID=A0A1G7Y0M0_9BACT|nr:T9SS type A sorting domain-containing protein [Dyadobacter soli]SDG90015.1 Por secretion system C-terminal sorting domain-containing protein [Dyadobacter soli]
MYKFLLPLLFLCAVGSTSFAQKTWTGTSSERWTDDGNWEPLGIPASAANITIPEGTPNSPVVPAGSNINFGSIKLNHGATFTVEAGATMTSTASQNRTLEILGRFINYGTITITNNAVGPQDWAAIEINNGGLLGNAGTLTETGTISVGIFVVSGELYNASGGLLSLDNNFGLVSLPRCDIINENGAEIRVKGTLFSIADIVNNGKFVCDGNVMLMGGTTKNEECAHFQVNGSLTIDDEASRGMTNEGTTIITDSLKLPMGIFENAGILKLKTLDAADQDNFKILYNQEKRTGSALVTDDPKLLIIDYGTESGFDILGIFSDQEGTQTAGTFDGYDFTPVLSLPPGSQTLYVQMVINHSDCVYTVPFNYVMSDPPGTWTGAHSSAWSRADNWTYSKVPDATMNVYIPAGTPNDPVISVANAVTNDLTIAAGASLTMTGRGVFAIYGNAINNGAFYAGVEGAWVAFVGTGTQTIPGVEYSVLSLGGDARKQLTGDASVNSLILLSGNTKVALGDNDIALVNNALIEGAGAGSYFITDGTGGFKKENVGSQEFSFPVGTESGYSPVVLSNLGIADNFTVRAGDGAYPTYADNVPQGSPVTSMAVNKTWYVSEDVPGGSNVTMSLTWNKSDELPSFDRGMCFISHYKNNKWDEIPAGSVEGSDPYTERRSGITSFSPFAVTNPNSPLPVTLARFDVVSEGNTALLSWSTTSETNSDRFEVERSSNAKDWESIGAVGAARESQVLTDYRFVDSHPLVSKESFYRLRMVDTDGTFAYSRIRNLSFSGSGKSLAYPNPATEKLFVQNSTQVSSARISDMNGKVVYWTSKVSDAGIRVDNLPAGLYVMEISWTNGLKAVQKILIER